MNSYSTKSLNKMERYWITNGIDNKWHDPKLPIPKGWIYGRTL